MTTQAWNIDTTHSGINFSIRHMVVSKVRGRFAKYSGKVELDDEDLTRSIVEATIDAASIDTGTQQRDDHLRSADFFEVEKFPELRFRSTRIDKLDDEHYRLIGELTIRDVKREVALEVEYGGRATDPWGNQRIGFIAKGSVDRKDFGLKWNQVLEAGGVIARERSGLCPMALVAGGRRNPLRVPSLVEEKEHVRKEACRLRAADHLPHERSHRRPDHPAHEPIRSRRRAQAVRVP